MIEGKNAGATSISHPGQTMHNDGVPHYRFFQRAREMSRLAKLFIRTPASRRFHSRSTIVAALRCAGLTDRRLRRSLAGYSVQPRASRRGWILTPVAGCWNARRVTLSSLAHNYTRLPRRGLRPRIVPPVDTPCVSFAPRGCPQTEGTKMSSQILLIVRKNSIITLLFKVRSLHM